jgi:hypothetical protein
MLHPSITDTKLELQQLHQYIKYIYLCIHNMLIQLSFHMWILALLP